MMAKSRKAKGKNQSVKTVTVGDTVALANGAVAKVTGVVPFEQRVVRTCEGAVVTFQVVDGDMKNANFDGVFLNDDELNVLEKKKTPKKSIFKRVSGFIFGKAVSKADKTEEKLVLPPPLPVWDEENKRWVFQS